MMIMKKTLKQFSLVALSSMAFTAGVAYGQGGRGGGGGWTTSRGDAQRTAWVRSDGLISVDNLRKPGFGLEWTVKVGHTPREVLSEGVSGNTTQLDPAGGNIAGSGNNVYSYEVDTGYLIWTRHFDAPAGAAPTAACPGGMTSGVTRATQLNQTISGPGPGRAGNGGAGYTGGVGMPDEGVPTSFMSRGGGRGGSGGRGGGGAGRGPSGGAGGFAGAAPGGSGRGPGGGGGGGGLRGNPADVYAVASDGMLHIVGQQQGKETAKPVPFLPANANVGGTILVNQVLYATTINNCGGVANGLWAIDMANGNAVTSWKSGASPAGEIALASNGTVYVAIGDAAAGAGGFSDAIVALDPKTLAVKDSFTMPGASFSSTPVIFTQSGREFVAAATKDGRVFLLDAASLGGADHKTALAISAATTTSKTWSPGALATWEDSTQTRWLLLPAVAAKGGIAAFKVTGATLQQAWMSSSEMASPSAPVVVNGVVFALNNGSATSPAVLYALDGATGKELWNSGKTITSLVRSAGLWAINGQVHVATSDAMVYAFGFAADRHPVH
jgi:hypothetical protein